MSNQFALKAEEILKRFRDVTYMYKWPDDDKQLAEDIDTLAGAIGATIQAERERIKTAIHDKAKLAPSKEALIDRIIDEKEPEQEGIITK